MVQHREVYSYSTDLSDDVIDRADGDAQSFTDEYGNGLGVCHVVETEVAGGKVENLFTVTEKSKFKVSVKYFQSQQDRQIYINQKRDVYVDEFLHKDFENPESIFYQNK